MKRFDALDAALEAESWEWLEANQPVLAEALQVEIGHGATAEQIKRRVVALTDRWELARRCELAAKFLARMAEA